MAKVGAFLKKTAAQKGRNFRSYLAADLKAQADPNVIFVHSNIELNLVLVASDYEQKPVTVVGSWPSEN